MGDADKCPGPAEIVGWLSLSEASEAAREFHRHARTCDRCRVDARRAAERVLGRHGGHVEPIALSRYRDGEVSEATRLLLEMRLTICPDCGERLEAMRQGRDIVSGQTTRDFTHRPVEAPPARRVPRCRPLLAPALAGAAALALLWFGAARLGDPGGSSLDPPTTVATRPPQAKPHPPALQPGPGVGSTKPQSKPLSPVGPSPAPAPVREPPHLFVKRWRCPSMAEARNRPMARQVCVCRNVRRRHEAEEPFHRSDVRAAGGTLEPAIDRTTDGPLPSGSNLTEEQQDRVIAALRQTLATA